MKNLFLLALVTILALSACEDAVNIPLGETDPILNVDAWLTHTSDTQRITLSYTRPYFDNSAPAVALGATVIVAEVETQKPYLFEDTNNDGTYVWIPALGEKFGVIGNSYGLQVELKNGSVFQSFSAMDSVPNIDSITFEYNKKNPGFKEDWYYAEFWSRDLPETGDTYWIKTTKNGKLFDKPDQINIAYDAGGSAGAEVDNLIFIQPIRIAINDFGDDAQAASPYTFGDTLKVEIHSISEEAWFFLYRVIDETSPQPSFAQLFANPLANSPTNIVPSKSDDQVVGFFSVAAVSSLEVIMSEENTVDRVPE